MMTMRELTDRQRKIVEWEDGPLLVLAGPNAGKTRVLTRRVARLLETSPNERFRILGLTFTNKAAHEMRTRVAETVSGAMDRVEISTFHDFCAKLLRQHGAHCGVRSDFEIYSRTADRKAVLADALRRRPDRFGNDDNRFLPRIDALKAALAAPEEAERRLHDLSPETAGRIALAYQLYEEELARCNALDSHSLIFHAWRLMGYSALAGHCRTVYRHWIVDEFQDVKESQYRFFRRMAGDSFRQLVVVADDDQINEDRDGVRRIRSLLDDFGCEVIRLTGNLRSPSSRFPGEMARLMSERGVS